MTLPGRSGRLAALSLAVPSVALAACGGTSDASKIKDIINKVDRNQVATCDNASSKLLSHVGGSVQACKKAARAYPSKTRITGDIKVKVAGNSATADFKTSDGKSHHVGLVKQGGDWKLNSAN